jgi:hypothetical protein
MAVFAWRMSTHMRTLSGCLGFGGVMMGETQGVCHFLNDVLGFEFP